MPAEQRVETGVTGLHAVLLYLQLCILIQALCTGSVDAKMIQDGVLYPLKTEVMAVLINRGRGWLNRYRITSTPVFYVLVIQCSTLVLGHHI